MHFVLMVRSLKHHSQHLIWWMATPTSTLQLLIEMYTFLPTLHIRVHLLLSVTMGYCFFCFPKCHTLRVYKAEILSLFCMDIKNKICTENINYKCLGIKYKEVLGSERVNRRQIWRIVHVTKLHIYTFH